MQRVHVVNNKDIKALTGLTAYAVIPELLSQLGYKLFFKSKSENGFKLYYFHSKKIITKMLLVDLQYIGVRTVVLPLDFQNEASTVRTISNIAWLENAGFEVIGVLSKNRIIDDYVYFSAHVSNRVHLAFPCVDSEYGNGWGRFRDILTLINNKLWNLQRKYFLWDLENPAELSAYARHFSNRLSSTFTGFFSSRCYVDSLYGIIYSGSVGLFTPPLDKIDTTAVSYKHGQQFSAFRQNDELMRDFSSGNMGLDIWHEFTERLNLGGFL